MFKLLLEGYDTKNITTKFLLYIIKSFLKKNNAYK